jgi:Beta-glucosidase/6-phospho-beta-glucosidase/beta-galactosidase
VQRFAYLCALAAAVAAVFVTASSGAPGVQFGIQDDAWVLYGPGTLQQRLDQLQGLGVDVVRVSIHWNDVAPTKPDRALAANDPAYRWDEYDAVLNGLRARGIAPLVTLLGTPGWANGGSRPNVIPSNATFFADFAYAAAKRYPFVRDWTVWNEPNQRLGMSTPSPRLYVTRLLNPAYAAIHRANSRAVVAGGVTAPRGNTGGVGPLAWIRGMKAAHARLDAYAHHPYPARPTSETPFTGGCASCDTITMANLPRLLKEVRRDFGNKPVWLTEYAYQTNPPDHWLGVSPALQAAYIGQSSLRAFEEPGVTMLIHFLVRDEPNVARFQSGLFTLTGVAKPAASAFPFPLAQVSRSGSRVTLWGQVRPRRGAQPYRLEVSVGGRWNWSGGTASTSSLGFFSRALAAPRGSLVRIWSPRDKAYSWPVVVR